MDTNDVEKFPGSNATPPPDVVVKFYDEVELSYMDNLEKYLVENRLAPWEELVSRFPGISIQRVFISLPPERVQELEKSAVERTLLIKNSPTGVLSLLKLYRLVSPPDTNRHALAESVAEWKIVEFAYATFSTAPLPDSPNNNGGLINQQIHLGPAPESNSTKAAWPTSKADGRDMKFIDVERGWVLDHQNFINPATTTSVFTVADPATSQPSNDEDNKSHGAQVLGTVAAPDIPANMGGKTIGIAYQASGQVVSVYRTLGGGQEIIADAILKAVDLLSQGDILLVEAQAIDANNQLWPVETQWAEYQAIQAATNHKIIVIEPAGNGHHNVNTPLGSNGNELDAFIWQGAHIFNRDLPGEFRDSGAIMVGSATHASPHTRMLKTATNSESNYGSRVDCYAWGEQIRTTSGPDNDDYEMSFGSTSGASAMVAGVALIIQGLAKANGLGNNANHTYSPIELRDILRDSNYGTVSANPANDRIGVMPDLKKFIDNKIALPRPVGGGNEPAVPENKKPCFLMVFFRGLFKRMQWAGNRYIAKKDAFRLKP